MKIKGKKKNGKLKAVEKHVKADIKTWDKEKKEDKELLKKLKKGK